MPTNLAHFTTTAYNAASHARGASGLQMGPSHARGASGLQMGPSRARGAAFARCCGQAASGLLRASGERAASNSHFGRRPGPIPAKAGTTSAFSPVSAGFVVPPSGGSGQNANCCLLPRSSGIRSPGLLDCPRCPVIGRKPKWLAISTPPAPACRTCITCCRRPTG